MKKQDDPKHASLCALLDQRASISPQKVAYRFLSPQGIQTLTYAQLQNQSQQLAQAILKKGLPSHQTSIPPRAILLLPPGLDFVVSFYACLYAHVIAVPVPSPSSKRQFKRIQTIARNAQAALVICHESHRQNALEHEIAPKHLFPDTFGTEGLPREEKVQEVAFLQYTSGSTGNPKGVMVTQANLVANSQAFALTESPLEGPVISWLPHYHDMGLVYGIVHPLVQGREAVLMAPSYFIQDPNRWLQAIHDYRGQSTAAPDFAYALTARKVRHPEKLDLSSLKVAYNGAEPVRTSTLAAFNTALKAAQLSPSALCPGYGMAESTLKITTDSPLAPTPVYYFDKEALARNLARSCEADDPQASAHVSCGVPIPGTDVAIVDAETQQALSPGHIGEIWFHGSSVTKGYFQNEEATEETFAAELNGHQYLRTGDLGFLHEGLLFIAGRLKDLIIIRGQNLYPQDLEKTAQATHTGFEGQNAAAFALEDAVVLALEVDRHTFRKPLQPIAAQVRQAIATEFDLVPQDIVLLPPGALQITSSGKIRRRQCRLDYVNKDFTRPHHFPAATKLLIEQSLLKPLPEQADLEMIQVWLFDELQSLTSQPLQKEGGTQQLNLDSLLAAQLRAHMEELAQAQLSSTAFLVPQSFEELAQEIHENRRQEPDASQNTEKHLNRFQESLYQDYKLNPHSVAYNIPLQVYVDLPIDQLHKALQNVLDQHPQLHQTIDSQGNLRSGERIRVERHSFDSEQALEDHCHRILHTPFDLEIGPLIHAQILLDPTESRPLLFMVGHHILLDFRAMIQLIEQIFQTVKGLEVWSTSPETFVHWHRHHLQQQGADHKQYWHGQTIAPAQLPSDHHPPAMASYQGKTLTLSLPQSAQLLALAQGLNVTPYCLLFGGFQILLHHLAQQAAITTGAPMEAHGPYRFRDCISYLVNPVPITTHLKNVSVSTFLHQLRQQLFAAMSHRHYPLQDIQEGHLDRPGGQLFGTSFQLLHSQPAQLGRLALPIVSDFTYDGVRLSARPFSHGIAQFDLSFTIVQDQQSFILAAEFSTDLFTEARIQEWLQLYQNLLDAMIMDPEQSVGDLSLLNEQQRQALLELANGPEQSLARDTVHEDFARIAQTNPDAIAIVDEARRYTYAELLAYQRQLQATLGAHGVQLGDFVAIVGPPSPQTLAATLASFACGATLLPLDPSWPEVRTDAILEDARPKLVLSQALQNEALSIPNFAPNDMAQAPIVSALELPAYAIYTSGSTGKPTGVLVSHDALANHCQSIIDAYELTRMDQILPFASIAFDVSLEESMPSLLARACLHYTAPKEPEGLLPFIQERKVSVLNLPASFHAAWLEHLQGNDLPECLRLLIVGNEAVYPHHLQRWQQIAPHVPVLNAYGPTETTITASLHTQALAQSQTVPIGKSLPQSALYVLDAQLHLRPDQLPGQLAIAGPRLALGYLNHPRKTALSFVPNPFARDGQRLYLTGDQTRYNEQGNLLFLGRQDDQVKLRGFRITLGEVQTALQSFSGIERAAPLIIGKGDSAQLIAWLQAPKEPDGEALEQHLLEHLPPYMIPSAIYSRPQLPQLPSQKLDLRAIAALDLPKKTRQSRALNPIADTLQQIFAKILDHDDFQADDNFFQYGGHSLNATRLLAHIQEHFDASLSLVDLYESPTPNQLARVLQSPSQPVPVLEKSHRPVVLSPAQKRLAFLHQQACETGASHTFNMPLVLRFHGPLSVAALNKAWLQLQEDHHVLRTRPLPQPTLQKAVPPILVEQRDSQALQQVYAMMPFNLKKDIPARALLVRHSPTHHSFVIVIHHIAADGWSIDILIDLLPKYYRAALFNEAPPAMPEFQYSDYAATQEGIEQSQESLEYWRELLHEAPLQSRFPAQAQGPNTGITQTFLISEELHRGLLDLARNNQITPFMLLHGLFNLLLFHHSQQGQLLVGTPFAQRLQPQTQRMIGFFLNTLPIFLEMEAQAPFTDLLKQTRHKTFRAHQHSHVPFEDIVQDLQIPRQEGTSPLFQCMTILQEETPNLDFPGMACRLQGFPNDTTKLDLTLQFTPVEKGLVASFEAQAKHYSNIYLQGLGQQFLNLAHAAVRHPHKQLGQLSPLSPAQREEILFQLNPVIESAPPKTLFHLLIDALKGNHTALIYEEETITASQLLQGSRALAARIQSLKLQPEAPIAICLPNSPGLITAICAAILSKHPYLPLDPSNNPTKLQDILDDAAAPLLITEDRQLRASNVWDASSQSFGVKDYKQPAPPHPLSAAYIIYTSGSTGRPKGIVGTHAAYVNRLQFMWQLAPFQTGERCCLKTSMGFVDAISEVFGPLLQKVPLLLVPQDIARNPVELVPLLKAQDITRFLLVPSLLRSLLDHFGKRLSKELPKLKTWVSSGESLPPDLLQRFQTEMPLASLLNLYGSSEVAADVTYHQTTIQRGQNVPIGRPIGNTKAHVLDKALEPLPLGASGHLFIGGVPLARGYYGRPALTAISFLPDPHSRKPGERLYRTGDLARYDGHDLICLGRSDRQIKISGIRIEPAHIEGVLQGLSGVKQALVIARHEPTTHLLVYVVPNDSKLTVQAVQDYAVRNLDMVMRPQGIALLDTFPLNASGKIQIQALPDIKPTDEVRGPVSPRAEVIAQLIARITRQSMPSHGDFFHHGGNSLLATQVLVTLNEHFKASLQLQDIFNHSTPVALDRLLSEVSNEIILPWPTNADPQLSLAQEALFSLEERQEHYSIHAALRIEGPLDVPRLESAWANVVAAHPMLRVHFTGTPLKPVKLENLPSLEVIQGSFEDLVGLRQRPIAIEGGPLWQSTLLQTHEHEAYFLLMLHHSIADGTSLSIMVQDLQKALFGEVVVEQPETYYAFAAYQRDWLESSTGKRANTFWQDLLTDVPQRLDLHHSQAKPSQQARTHVQVIDPGITAGLKTLAQEQGVTLYMLLQSAFAFIAQTYSQQERFLVALPYANRHAETQGSIGFYANTLVQAFNFAGIETFDILLQRTREQAIRIFEHGAMPTVQLMKTVSLERQSGVHPLYQVMFAMQDVPIGELEITDCKTNVVDLENRFSPLELTLSIRPEAGQLRVHWEHDTSLFPLHVIQAYATHFRYLLDKVVAEPDANLQVCRMLAYKPLPHRELPAIDPIATWLERGTGLAYDQPAVTHEELQARVARLSCALRLRGAGTQVPVIVCLPQGLDGLVAALAVLYIGATLVPVDPASGQARQAKIAAFTKAELAVADTDFHGLTTLRPESGDAADAEDYQRPLPQALAAVFFTSGTSGAPKGVALSYGNLQTHCAAVAHHYQFDSKSRALHMRNLAFDAALEEALLPLMSGSALVGGFHIQDDLNHFDTFVAESKLTHLNLPAAIFRTWLQVREMGPLPSCIQCIISGGEALSRDDLKRWQRIPNPPPAFNAYGPSEAAITATLHDLNQPSFSATVPIGQPTGNGPIHVLDPRGNQLPTHVPGQVHIAGPRVAQGYLHQPALTAQKFHPDPFSTEPGSRLYSTGDRALQDQDRLYFMGRFDQQLKLRGIRIEPAQIEAVLCQLPEIHEAAIIPSSAAPPFHLIAILTGREIDVETCRQYISNQLSSALVPSHFHIIPNMPRTSGTKIDRAALRQMNLFATQQTAEPLPNNPVQQTLLKIWQQVLGTNNLTIRSDFFQNGGDSISALQITALARQHQLQIKVADLIQNPSIATLTPYVISLRQEDMPLEVPQNLSNLQETMLQESPSNLDHFQQVVRIHFQEPISHQQISEALEALIKAHPILRLHFPGGQPKLQDFTPQAIFSEKDGFYLTQEINLQVGPLLKAHHTGTTLTLAIHHFIIDGVSWRILLQELSDFLKDQRKPNVEASFAQHLKGLNSHEFNEDEKRYWQELQQNYPTFQPCTAPQTQSRTLSTRDTHKLLNQASQRLKASTQELLLTALAIALKQDEVIDLEGHGRQSPYYENAPNAIGWFTCIYPILLSAQSEPHQTLRRIKQSLRDVPHQGTTYPSLKPERHGRILFNYLGQLKETGLGPIANIEPLDELSEQTITPFQRHPITLDLVVQNQQLHIHAHVSANQVNGKHLLDAFLAALQSLIQENKTKDVLIPSDFPQLQLSQHNLNELSINRQPQDLYPLTPLQEGLLSLALDQPHSGAYIMQVHGQLVDELDAERFRNAWMRVLEHHSATRTCFPKINSQHIQAVYEFEGRHFFQIQDTHNLEDFLKQDRERGFDLINGPLMRFTFLAKRRIVWTTHHLILDGWSMQVLLAHLLQSIKQPDQPLPTTTPFANAVSAMVQDGSSKDYWRKRLQQLPEVSALPFLENPQAATATQSHQITLSSEQTQKLQDSAQKNQLTLPTYLSAAWASLIRAHTYNDTVCFGQVHAGRHLQIPHIQEAVGLYIQTLPHLVHFPQTTLRQWLLQIQDNAFQDAQHGHLSPANIQSQTDVPHNQPLYHSTLVFQNYPEANHLLPVVNMKVIEQVHQALSITAIIEEGRLQLQALYPPKSFKDEDINRILQQLSQLISSIPAQLNEPRHTLHLFTQEEKRHLLSGPAARLPFTNLPQAIHAAVQRHPQRLAVAPDLTYAKLWERASRSASTLREMGVQPQDVVAVKLPHSQESIVAMLAISLSRAIYLPLDPFQESQRQECIVTLAGARTIIHEGISLGEMHHFQRPHPQECAYIIYTSGSTGQPKGVAVSHYALCNYLHHTRHYCPDTGTVPLFTAPSFDATITAIWAPLVHGLSIHPIPSDPPIDDLIKFLRDNPEPAFIKCTPAHLNLVANLAPEVVVHLKTTIIVGGEALTQNHCQPFKAATIINEYGPTEATVGCTVYTCKGSEKTNIPIGKSIQATQVHLIDQDLNLVPERATGQLTISGQGLAICYHHDPRRTALRFIPNPMAKVPGQRIYLTGDLASYDTMFLQYHGRRDQQIKLRGYRIETAEIDAALQEQPDIQQAITFFKEQQLISVITPAIIDCQKALEKLHKALPAFMVPNQIFSLDTLPLTANGKIDLRQLNKLVLHQNQGIALPQTPTQKQLTYIWEKALHTKIFNIHVDFFQLGGHSLPATQIIAAIHETFGIILRLAQFFEQPTIAAQAQHIDALSTFREKNNEESDDDIELTI